MKLLFLLPHCPLAARPDITWPPEPTERGEGRHRANPHRGLKKPFARLLLPFGFFFSYPQQIWNYNKRWISQRLAKSGTYRRVGVSEDVMRRTGPHELLRLRDVQRSQCLYLSRQQIQFVLGLEEVAIILVLLVKAAVEGDVEKWPAGVAVLSMRFLLETRWTWEYSYLYIRHIE